MLGVEEVGRPLWGQSPTFRLRTNCHAWMMEVNITILYSHSYFTKSTRHSYFKRVSQKFKIHQALMEVNRKSIFVGCTASFFHNALSKTRETGWGREWRLWWRATHLSVTSVCLVTVGNWKWGIGCEGDFQREKWKAEKNSQNRKRTERPSWSGYDIGMRLKGLWSRAGNLWNQQPSGCKREQEVVCVCIY